LPIITIAGTPIDFPDTGNSPIWSDAIIQFAQAVELALSGVVGAGDLGKNTFLLDSSHNPVTNLNITDFTFEPSLVRSVFARYYVYRQTSTTKVMESGTLTMVYNPSGSSQSKWQISRSYVNDASCTFNITDAGQVRISLTSISGSNHVGQVSFVAQVLTQAD